MLEVLKLPLFDLGQLLATPGAVELERQLIDLSGLALVHYIARHWTGDWGDLTPHDVQVNRDALENGTRILSSYQTPAGKLWIITEADRSATTCLLPEEY
jgi:hypothetical protein